MPKSILELRTLGFAALEPGKIHLRCPGCGRKMSNTLRGQHDPIGSYLVEVECPACGIGCFPEPSYFDAAGEPIEWRGETREY